ncbi:MAG: TolC family protein [Bacteroidaceae bacterium]|nr:TolC family protein [Bacteroidaceae bacterium]
MKNNIISLILLAWCFPAFSQVTSGEGLPLSLQDCRRMALEQNEKIKTADNAVIKAKLDRQIAFAQYLPKIDGSFMLVHMKNIDLLDQDILGLSLQTHGTYLAGITVTLPLYAGGQITSANRLASIGETVSLEQQRKTRMQVIADVDNAYYMLIAVHSKVQMLEAYALQMQELYDQVKLATDVQMATENDLLRIATKQNEVSYQLQKARNGEQLCGLALANVIGTDLEQTIIPTDTVLSVAPASQLSEDFSTRPDLLLLQQQVKASEVLVKKSRSNYLPTVALVGRYSHYNNLKLKGDLTLPGSNSTDFSHNFSGHNPMALLSVSLPIFHWGAELKKVKKAKLDLNDAKLQLQQNERGMRVEVRKAVQNVTDSQLMVETATIGRKQADENLRVMRQKFDNQLCTMTDLLDAQSQWQQARSNLIEAQTQLKIYETEYLRVTGKLE